MVYAVAALSAGMLGRAYFMTGALYTGANHPQRGLRAALSAAANRAKNSAVQCAAIVAVQGAAFPFLYTIFAKYHKKPFITKLCASLANMLGAATGAGILVSDAGEYLVRLNAQIAPLGFSAVWEKTGAFYLILVLLGGAALLLLRRAKPARFAALLGLCAAYLILRYTALILVYIQYPIHNIFWERAITFVSLAPLALMLSCLFAAEGASARLQQKPSPLPQPPPQPQHAPTPPQSPPQPQDPPTPPQPLPQPLPQPQHTPPPPSLHRAAHIAYIALVASASLLALSAAAYFGFRDPGTPKAGRVLVDEYHSDWEWTDEAYDENWFGERSGYNYYCFYEYIDKHYETSRNTEPITPQLLSQADILIIKTPTEPFSADEVSAIHSFVGSGGGLYLIGDHTNVFGTGTNLNRIAPMYGIRFLYDCTYELTQGNLSEFNAPLLMPHPVVRDLPHFLFATSNTLETTMLTEDVILGYGLKNYQADYSQRNFFPEDTNSGDVEFGAFVQCAAASYKKGRVLAFTDSTVFSNFWMHMRGKPELLLGSLDWLNRENVLPAAPRAISLAAMLASAVAASASAAFLAAFKLLRKKRMIIAGCTLGASALIGIAIFSISSRIGGLPAPIRPIVNIHFENEYSAIELPIDIDGFLAPMDRQFSTFYVWTQRLGYVPSLDRNLRSALRDASAERGVAVVSKPAKPFANTREIMRYINEGATLLILDNAESGAHSNSLLALAGMEIVEAEIQAPVNYAPPSPLSPPQSPQSPLQSPPQTPGLPDTTQSAASIQGIPPTARASAVTGGTAIMADSSGNALYSTADIGLGRIAVFTDPDLFYNYELGDVSANLTDKTAILTRLALDILKTLADLPTDPLSDPPADPIADPPATPTAEPLAGSE